MNKMNVDKGYLVEGYQGRSVSLFDFYAETLIAAKRMATKRNYDRIKVRNADTETFPEDKKFFIKTSGQWEEVDELDFE